MGVEISAEEKNAFASEIFSGAQVTGLIPDIGIDKTLLMFSGLNSTAVLEEYTSDALSDLEQRLPGYALTLGSSLAAFAVVPNAVGLGAMIVTLLFDIILSSIQPKKDNTMNMIRRVFAEEKASGVRDSMDEYMKRLSSFINEPERVLEETARLEKQLSEQLTRLRNSMLYDDQMSSRSIKYWTNGAAFHVQMLTHKARLKVALHGSEQKKDIDDSVTSINKMADHYQRDLQDLLKKYRNYKDSTLTLKTIISACGGSGVASYCLKDCVLRDSEFSKYTYKANENLCRISSKEYVDYMFNNWRQIKELTEYFTVFKRNQRELIMQHQTFNLKI